MTADAYAVLIVVVMFAAGAFVNYLLREWPRAKRTLFDAHADDALRVVDEDDDVREEFRRANAAFDEWYAERYDVDEQLAKLKQRARDREAFERMIHPSAGNGLIELERRTR